MTKKYRTANGKKIDFDEIIIKNSETRAVGNMNVNAHGDVIDSQNNKIQNRNKKVNNNYNKQVSSENKLESQQTNTKKILKKTYNENLNEVLSNIDKGE